MIALPDADDEVRDLPGTFARIRIGARHWQTQAEFTMYGQMQLAFRESDSQRGEDSQEDACRKPSELRDTSMCLAICSGRHTDMMSQLVVPPQ